MVVGLNLGKLWTEESAQQYLSRHDGALVVVGTKVELIGMLPRRVIFVVEAEIQESHSFVVIVLSLSISVGIPQDFPVLKLLLVALLEKLTHFASSVQNVGEAFLGKVECVVSFFEQKEGRIVIVIVAVIVIVIGWIVSVFAAVVVVGFLQCPAIPRGCRHEGRQIVAIPFSGLRGIPKPIPAFHFTGPWRASAVADDRSDVN
mmetsp:Transcript_16170/g.33294  ORF Transcript_16170/g.33294 Transcript_16170/m.33294 type:complete len:203 (-) Transcript_16170:427-1035(-)